MAQHKPIGNRFRRRSAMHKQQGGSETRVASGGEMTQSTLLIAESERDPISRRPARDRDQGAI
jgi:hypothetical protein